MTIGLKRRDFLKLAGVAGAGLALGCSRKPDNLAQFREQPDDVIPGIPTYYATSCKGCPAGCGVIAKSREGRVIKVEGNPAHPVNRGGLCARGHAEIQDLYNPDRLTQPMKKSGGAWTPVSWDEALTLLAQKSRESGARTAVVTGHETGSLDRLVDDWLKGLGSTRHLRYEAFGFEPLREATRIAFGKPVVPYYEFARAHVVLSFGADFLETWLDPVGAARGMADARAGKSDGQRFIAFDSRPGVTAINADEFVSIKPGSEMAVALGLLGIIQAEGLGSAGVTVPPGFDAGSVEAASGVKADVLHRIAREFAMARPGLAVAGGVAAQGDNATAMQLAALWLNAAAGNIGQTVNVEGGRRYENAASMRDMKALAGAMNAGEVSTLIVYGPNPVFTLPQAVGFEPGMAKVGFKVAISRVVDETAELCDLILPPSHSLESWDDAEPVAGVHNLFQPAMRPVFDTRPAGEIFFTVARKSGMTLAPADWLGYIQDTWKSRMGGSDWSATWEKTVQSGGVFAPASGGSARPSSGAGAVQFKAPTMSGDGDYALLLVPSAHFYDGRGANRPWMQEVPDPVTKVMWSSWIEVSPAVAGRLGVKDGDLLSLDGLADRLTAPAWVHEGLRDDVAAVILGQGHTSYGRYAKGQGINPFRALAARMDEPSGAPAYLQARVRLSRAGGHDALPSTIGTLDQQGRGIAQVISIAQLLNPEPREKPEGDDKEQPYVPRYKKEYEKHPLTGDPMMNKHRWGMAIDLDRCTGCAACVTACYSENNIQWVGKKETRKNRNMAWIRIEKYRVERPDSSAGYNLLPMTCQQCDNAPCEYVCPVYATYHNPEGINAQIYNRCIGTRYCSNNCPYRVRKFNYQEPAFLEPLTWGLNPDVTVRSKGVMEKCNFCIQRIVYARNTAKDENRDILEGEATPACASSCPTQAIVFGDLDNPQSRVAQIAADPRGYRVLEVLNTQPNINYLKRVRREPAKA